MVMGFSSPRDSSPELSCVQAHVGVPAPSAQYTGGRGALGPATLRKPPSVRAGPGHAIQSPPKPAPPGLNLMEQQVCRR